MNVVDCIQGSPEWFACRAGCVTASRLADVVNKLQDPKKESAARRDLRFDLLGEKLTGRVANHVLTPDMLIGIEREPIARAEYELETDRMVELVGFVYHPTIKMAGASPDGLVGGDGLIEIKCPRLNTHLKYMTAKVVPKEYQPQMQWQMACCERQWVDFVSYHPDLPEPFNLFVKRLERDDALIRGYEADAVQLLSEVDEMLKSLRESIAEEVGA